MRHRSLGQHWGISTPSDALVPALGREDWRPPRADSPVSGVEPLAAEHSVSPPDDLAEFLAAFGSATLARSVARRLPAGSDAVGARLGRPAGAHAGGAGYRKSAARRRDGWPRPT